jgi:hypothetical protein
VPKRGTKRFAIHIKRKRQWNNNAEILWPQGIKFWHPPETGRGKEGSSPRAARRRVALMVLLFEPSDTPDFQTTEL